MKPMHIDFVKSGGMLTTSPSLGWLVLAAGLVMTCMAGDQFLQWRKAQAVLNDAREQQVRAMAEQERQRVAALPPSIPPFLDDKRWQLAAVELKLPWMPTLQAIEHATKPPVFLTGFKSDLVSGRLQLDAEAPSFDAALSYVTELQAQPALVNTQLIAHDESPNQQGQQQGQQQATQVRFSLQTHWVVAR